MTTISPGSPRLLRLEERPDGICLHLAPIGIWKVRRSFATTVLVALAAAALLKAGDRSAGAVLCCFAFLNFLVCLIVARRGAVLALQNHRLQIHQSLGRLLRGRRLTVPHDHIIALNALGGLRIVTAAREWCLFAERDPTEIAYLADLFRQALQIPEEVALREWETLVQFVGPLWPQRTLGVLGARAGELTLRNSRQLVPFFIFKVKNGPHSAWDYGSALNVINLEPHEIVGRSPVGRLTSLVISPTTPLFLRRNYTIPPGVAGPKLRTLFFWRTATFQIFSEDAEALQAALATFWGSGCLKEEKH